MSNRTPIYKYLYLEQGDLIYPQFDQDNMSTSENQFFGMYDYIGQGIVNGWQIIWMGCKSNPYVMQQRQALMDAYHQNPFSYLALEYESIGKPGPLDDAAWSQCIVVTPGLGVISVFHAATEYPSFFRFSAVNHYYVWAQKNVCTNTEYLCEIIAPLYPDPDYDLYNPAIYIGEVYVNNVTIDAVTTIQITQIAYSDRRNDLAGENSQLQKLLQQALLNHVHSGEDGMPSKINLSDEVVIKIDVTDANQNAFNFTPPTGIGSYGVPQVFLNSNLLLSSQYQISGSILFLQNSVPINSTINIIYPLAPGPICYINTNENAPLISTILQYINPDNSPYKYIITNGTTYTGLDGETKLLKIFKWNSGDYSNIQVYLNNLILEPNTYKLDPINGTIYFLGPILPSISDYSTSNIIIKFLIPQIQITGILPSSKIASINASSIKSGTIPPYRLSGLDHLGFFRINEPANIIPYKKLLDSGDHINFYPVINCPIQHSDTIVFAKITNYVKVFSSESTVPQRTIISTPNGLFATIGNSKDFSNIYKLNWSTDYGVADRFSENYFGNFIAYSASGALPPVSTLNPKYFWVLSKSVNQFKNILYLSRDFGINFSKITLPLNSSYQPITVNDFVATVNVYQYTTGEVILTPHLAVNNIFYIAATDGLYSATLLQGANPLQPIWNTPTTNTTNYPTGSINRISEAVNVGVITTSYDTGLTERDFENYRALYAAADNGLFVYLSGTGTLFTTNALNTTYNQNSSKFTYVKWLGDDPNDSSNKPELVVWSDNYGIYLSNSSQLLTTVTTSTTSRTTKTTYYEALTQNLSQITVASASSANPYTQTSGNIDITQPILNINGYALANNNYVLLKNQDDPTQNGVYVYNSSSNLLYYAKTISGKRILVLNGEQANTEWIELVADPSNPNQRLFALFYANILSYASQSDLGGTDYVVSVTKDASSGPLSDTTTQNYYNSFFVATTSRIFRVLCYSDQSIMPVVIPIVWDTTKYGIISSIRHYSSLSDIVNGTLVVFTSNGIFRSSAEVFNQGLKSYQRFINTITIAQEQANLSVYDEYTSNQYTGKITLITSPYISNGTPIDGFYQNSPFFSGTSGTGLTIDITISGGVVSAYSINNPGRKYSTDVLNGYCNLGSFSVYFQKATTEGTFSLDLNSQAVTYSKSLNPSRLLYEVDFTNYYVKPWVGYPLIIAQVNGVYGSQYPFSYDSSSGLIKFTKSLNSTDRVTISLTNIGQYISSAGNTPHGEVFNIITAQPNPAAVLASTYDPTTAKDTVLPLDHFDNTLWSSNTSIVKIIGLRPSSSNPNIQQQYTELIQVSVAYKAGKVYIIPPLPSTLPLTSGSKVYIGQLYNDVLGIEDKITLGMTQTLTYHMDSVSHANVYNLYNALTNISSSLISFPVIPGENLSGVDRGLKNTIAISSLSSFDPSATFTGYTFGVDPSSYDVAAAPSTINLILDFQYGNNPLFATDKGIWSYIRSSSTWNRVDTINNSKFVYFANKALTDSLGNSYIYAGTDLGLFYQSGGVYVQNSLFTEPVISINMGEWFVNNSGSSTVKKRYEAYGKQDGLSFVLRTTNATTGATSLSSDFFEGYKIYDIYYDTFYRYDENNNRTEHPAIYLATDYSVWAFTTDKSSNSPNLVSPHTLLYGREMFGNNIILNINKLNASLPGLPAKVFKIQPVPSGGKNTWLIILTSNGVYQVINWKQCDVADPAGLVFYPQNKSNNLHLVGRQCYCITKKINDSINATWFVGTDSGVYRSIDRCGSFTKTSKFAGQDLSVSDMKYFTNSTTNYLVAATNIGLWVTLNDGDTWYSIKDAANINDVNVEILSNPTYGIPLDLTPRQSFQSISTGTIDKVFIYLNPQNLPSSTIVSAFISNGVAVTQSYTSLSLSSESFPSMYGFQFTNCPVSSNQTYYLGITTDGSSQSSYVTWGLSNRYNPYANGEAQTENGALTGKDFFFRINVSTPAQITEIVEPVGYYNSSSVIGFASGTLYGASISSNGSLISNVGVICSVLFDDSKSMEINDTGIITQSGISSDYVTQAVINVLVN